MVTNRKKSSDKRLKDTKCDGHNLSQDSFDKVEKTNTDTQKHAHTIIMKQNAPVMLCHQM